MKSTRLQKERLGKLGLPFDDEGMCYGKAATDLHEFLVGNIQHAIHRDYVINSIPIDDFTPNKISETLLSRGENITYDEIVKYFTTIIAYHDYQALANLTNHTKRNIFLGYQDLIISSQQLRSNKLTEMGGLHKIDTLLFAFDYPEMVEFLNCLKILFQMLDAPSTIALFIQSHDHAITLAYDIKIDLWYILNANTKSCDKDKVFNKDVKIIAESLIKCFSKNGNVVISIDFISCGAYLNKVSVPFNRWRNAFSNIKIRPREATIRDSSGCTLLYLSADLNYTSLAIELINNGASPGHDVKGVSPLLRSVANNNLILVKLFLNQYPININQADPESGKTPLIVAAENGWEEMVITLLSYGASTAIKDNNNNTANMLAADSNIRSILKVHNANILRPVSANTALLFSRSHTYTMKDEQAVKKPCFGLSKTS